MASAIQHSFSGGQLSPTLWNRVDHQKYSEGLKKNRNMIVARDGSIMNRGGTQFVGVGMFPTKTIRLIPFEISLSQSYVLEFGDKYIHFIKNGQYVYLNSYSITAATNASPGVFTFASGSNQGITSANIANGMFVELTANTTFLSACGNMISGRFFTLANVTIGANSTTFTLLYLDGNAVNTTTFGAYTSGDIEVNMVYSVATPYVYTDLANLKFDQSVDVMTLCHPSYSPQTLTYTSNTSWAMATLLFVPSVPNSTAVGLIVASTGSGGGGGGGTNQIYPPGVNTIFSSQNGSPSRGLNSSSTINPASDNVYKVTSVNLLTGEESFPGFCDPSLNSAVISGYTNANPCVLTLSAVTGSFNSGEQWSIRNTTSPLDGKVYIISKIDSTHVSLNGIDSTNYPVFSSAGVFEKTSVSAGTAAVPSLGTPTVLNWSDANVLTFPVSYNVYASLGGVFGFIGTAPYVPPGSPGVTTFKDTGFVPDMSKRPPDYIQVMDSPNNYPSVSCFYQQRHCFANTNKQPATVFCSQNGFFTNFTSNTPVEDGDAVIFQLVSSKIDPVMNMLDIGNLIIFTQNNEYAILGNNTSGQFGALTPTAINAEVQSFHGSAALRPVRVDNSAIYLQSRGNILRDLNYFFAEDKYKGNDLTVFAKDLFDNYTTIDMDYGEIPNHNLYCVRNDGKLLCLTYVKEQNVLAWGYWDSPNGSWKNVCVIPENGYDVPYFVVNRLVIDDTGLPVTYQYIERAQTRIAEISDQTLMNFMDSTGTYNGNNTTATTMTLSGGVQWTKNELLTLTASAGYFVSSMVGQQIQIKDASGNLIRFTINNVSSGTVCTGLADDTVPVDMRGVAFTTWALALNTITGLWWLNGLTVSVLGDGYVVASPYNSGYQRLTVTNGTLTIPNCYAVVSVGIPYLSDIKTLDMDVVGYSVFMGKTSVDKWKNISEVTGQIVQTRGGFYGSADPDTESANTTGDALFKLFEMKPSNFTDTFNNCPPLITDNVKMSIEGGWDIHGNVFIRQPDPLPICLSSIAYAGNLPLRDVEAPQNGGLPK